MALTSRLDVIALQLEERAVCLGSKKAALGSCEKKEKKSVKQNHAAASGFGQVSSAQLSAPPRHFQRCPVFVTKPRIVAPPSAGAALRLVHDASISLTDSSSLFSTPFPFDRTRGAGCCLFSPRMGGGGSCSQRNGRLGVSGIVRRPGAVVHADSSVFAMPGVSCLASVSLP